MKKNHLWPLVLSILLIPSLVRADGDVEAEKAKSRRLPLRPVTDSYVLPDGRTVTFLVKTTEVEGPLAPWVKPVAIGSAIGMVLGFGTTAVAWNQLDDAKKPASQDLWTGVFFTGTIVGATSVACLLTAGAYWLSRPPSTQNVTITPVVSASNSGLMITGSF